MFTRAVMVHAQDHRGGERRIEQLAAPAADDPADRRQGQQRQRGLHPERRVLS